MSKQQQADSSTDYLSPEQADEALKKMIRGDKNGNRTLVLSPEIDHIPRETILNFIQENNITAVGNVIIALMSQRRECSYDLFTYQCSEYKINPNFLRILDIIKDANITSLDLIGLDYGASDWGFDYFRRRGGGWQLTQDFLPRDPAIKLKPNWKEVKEAAVTAVMERISSFQNLTSLSLSGDIGEHGAQLLLGIIHKHNITDLMLGNVTLLPETFAKLFDADSPLTTLELWETHSPGPLSFAALQHNQCLRSLTVNGHSDIRDKAVEELLHISNSSALERIVFKGRCGVQWGVDRDDPNGDFYPLRCGSFDILTRKAAEATLRKKISEFQESGEKRFVIRSYDHIRQVRPEIEELDEKLEALSLKLEEQQEVVEEIGHTLARQSKRMQQLQLFVENTQKLAILAEASPQTLNYLRILGDNGSQAEVQYATIHSNPALASYYTTLNRSITSTLMASQSIFSGMVDASHGTAVQLLSIANSAAKSTNIPALPLLTGIMKLVGETIEARGRQKIINRLTTRTPTLQHYAIIEMMARELTLE